MMYRLATKRTTKKRVKEIEREFFTTTFVYWFVAISLLTVDPMWPNFVVTRLA